MSTCGARCASDFKSGLVSGAAGHGGIRDGDSDVTSLGMSYLHR